MVTVTSGRKSVRLRRSLLVHLAADAPRFFDRLVAVLVGQAEFPDDDLVVDTGLVDVAEHFVDPAERSARRGRPSGDLDDDHVAGLRVQVLIRRDLDVHDQPPVERHHEARFPMPSRSKRPTIVSEPRSSTRTIRPSARSPLTRSRRATTRSPCIAWFKLLPAM